MSILVCPPEEELPSWNTLPPEDPRRRHAEECPRCRSWWLEFQDFEKAMASDTNDADVENAVARLRLPRRLVPRRRPLRWLVAASLPLVLGGLWWASALRAPDPVRWRGDRIASAHAPFGVELADSQLTLTGVSPDVVSIRWIWIDAGLDELESRAWADRQWATRSLRVPPRPEGSRFWQLEWTLEDGSVHGGELHELE